MPRGNPQPWLRNFRNRPPCWYVQLDGHQVRLSEDRDEAFRLYHRLMVDRREKAPPAAPPRDALAVGDLFEAFLAWAEANRTPRTYRLKRHYLRSFALHAGAESPASRVGHAAVDAWLAAHPSWGRNSRRTAAVTVKQAVLWGFRRGLVPANTLDGYRSGRGVRRESVLTPEEFEAMLAECPDPSFVALLRFCWETGARPQEAVTVSREHLQPGGRSLVLPASLSKGGTHRRVIPLSERAAAVFAEACAASPAGPAFRTTRGLAWNSGSVPRAFYRLQVRRGLKLLRASGWVPAEADVVALTARWRISEARARRKLRDREAAKLAPKHCLYELRHSFATRALRAGASVPAVAAAMGHRNASMVLDVYQHLAQDEDYVRRELGKLG